MSSYILGTYMTILVHVSLAGAMRGSYNPNSDQDNNKDTEELEDAQFFNRKETDRPSSTTLRYSKGEVVVEKFVETLMASEKYLKMIESVERKLNHLDATFHERTNSILKYIAELQRNMKTSPAEALETALRSVKSDLDEMKHTIMAHKDIRPNMRGKDIVDKHQGQESKKGLRSHRRRRRRRRLDGFASVNRHVI